MKMIQVLKEEVNTSIKKSRETQSSNWRKINKSIKDSQEKRNNRRKPVDPLNKVKKNQLK